MAQKGYNPDPKMWVDSSIHESDVRFLNVREKPFRLYGFYNPLGENEFKRLPDEIGKNVSEGVAALYRNTAGGRVRFSTDSRYIAIRAVMPDAAGVPHAQMPLSGSSGFDLYLDDPVDGSSRFVQPFMPPSDLKGGYESILYFSDRRTRHFTIHFPLYANVRDLFVGIEETASLGEGVPYRGSLPIVYYGSSITQGGCASRGGMAYEAIISRRLNLDFINLGFSGSGKAEDRIIDYMTTLPMCAFVSDYDHNAPSPEYLRETHHKLYRAIRKAHPNVPYLMISRPDFFWNHDPSHAVGSEERRNVILDSYHAALNEGDENVHFLDGETFFGKDLDYTADGTHPNDRGFARMAEVIGDRLSRLTILP